MGIPKGFKSSNKFQVIAHAAFKLPSLLGDGSGVRVSKAKRQSA